MLRNWSEVIPAGSPAAGALVSGTNFVGLLGSEIDTTASIGTHGPGVFAGWDMDPAKRYRVLVTALTGGPLLLREDGSGEATPPFNALLSVYEDNVLVEGGVGLGGVTGIESHTSGSSAQVLITASGGGVATEAAQGAASAYVEVLAAGAGVAMEIHSSGGSATVSVLAAGNGAATIPTNGGDPCALRSHITTRVDSACRGKVYVGDTGTVIVLDCGQNISAATERSIEVRKPDGATATWAAVADDTNAIAYTSLANTFDLPGLWRLQARVTLPSGRWTGATVLLEVHRAFQ